MRCKVIFGDVMVYAYDAAVLDASVARWTLISIPKAKFIYTFQEKTRPSYPNYSLNNKHPMILKKDIKHIKSIQVCEIRFSKIYIFDNGGSNYVQNMYKYLFTMK